MFFGRTLAEDDTAASASKLELYFHPLASFCQKVLIALYENDTPFEPNIVDLSDAASRQAFLQLWPIGQFPVLRDTATGLAIPESTIIIEYLAQHHPGKLALVPTDPELAREARLRDRFYDLHVDVPMQKIVTDRLRPDGEHDRYGVAHAESALATAYDVIDAQMATRTWAAGEAFSMADCAAAPALFFAGRVVPFGDSRRNLAAYFERLIERPSFARVVGEARPYMVHFPA